MGSFGRDVRFVEVVQCTPRSDVKDMRGCGNSATHGSFTSRLSVTYYTLAMMLVAVVFRKLKSTNSIVSF